MAADNQGDRNELPVEVDMHSGYAGVVRLLHGLGDNLLGNGVQCDEVQTTLVVAMVLVPVEPLKNDEVHSSSVQLGEGRLSTLSFLEMNLTLWVD